MILKRLLYNILTNYIFEFAFWKEKYVEGCYLTIGDYYIIKYDSYYGNPGSIKWYLTIDGFWNYLKCDVAVSTSGELLNVNSVYKNDVRLSTEQEILMYDSKISER